MKNVTIKGLLAHKLRLALTSLAIVLGVTFVAGTFVLTDTLQNTFSSLFGNIYQKVDFQVRGVAQFSGNSANAVRNPMPESVFGTVRHVPGVVGGVWTGPGICPVRRPRRYGHPGQLGPHLRRRFRPRPSDVRAAPDRRKAADDLERRRDGRRHG